MCILTGCNCCSYAELGFLNAPHVALLFDNGINVGVELAHRGGLLLEFLGSSGVGVHVGGLSEESGTHAILRVHKHAVLVGVLSGRGILAEHGNLPAEIATLGSLSGGSLLGFFVENLAGFLLVTLNLDNVEHNAVGVASQRAFVVEEVLEGGLSKGGVLLVNFREDNSVLGNILSEFLLVSSPVVTRLAGDGLGELGASGEGQDVRVGSESKHVLGGGISGGRADIDNLTSTDGGELELEGKDVPWGAGAIRHAELPGVGVHLVDGANLGDAIKVLVVILGGRQSGVLVFGNAVVAGEVSTNPLTEGGKEGNFVLFEGSALARVAGGSVGAIISGEDGP